MTDPIDINKGLAYGKELNEKFEASQGQPFEDATDVDIYGLTAEEFCKVNIVNDLDGSQSSIPTFVKAATNAGAKEFLFN